LQGDPGDPAAALPDGRPEVAREKLAGRHGNAGIEVQRNENLRAAEGMQAVAVFVVFGEALGVEDAPLAPGRQAFQRGTPVAGPHAVGRQKAPEALAHGDVFGLELGELVAVEAVGNFANAGRQGQHGDLHHVVVAGEPVDVAERVGMDQVFGIMGRDYLKPHPESLLIVLETAVDPIEAVPLGGGTVVGTADQMHARVKASRLGHRADSGLVVGIDADEDVVIRVSQDGQIAFEHLADHAMLVPQGDKNGYAALGGLRESRVRRPRHFVSADYEDQADKQVVQPAEQNPERQRDKPCHRQVVQPHESD